MLNRIVLWVVLCSSFLASNAQNAYTSIGVEGNYFLPTTSKPTYYRNNKAQAFGIFFERYFKSNFKLKAGLTNFTSTYKAWYFNTSTSKRYEFDAEASFVSIPLTLSYNFNAIDNEWEFFVDAGYSLFIEQNVIIKDFTKDSALFPHDRVNTSKFYNYFTVGFSGRYKLYNFLSISMGTRSYHYLPLNSNFGNGFPTLSAYGGVAYIF
jgi:hypothetical protein